MVLEGVHVEIIAVRAPPDFEVELGKQNRLLISHPQHVQVGNLGKSTMAIDRLRNGRVVIAGQDHDRQRRRRDDPRGPIDQVLRQPMAIKRVAGQNNNISLRAERRAQHAGEPGRTIAAMQPGGVIVIDVQIGAVRDR